MRSATSLTPASSLFQDKCRLVCTDKLTANAKSERGIGHDRQCEGWPVPLLFHCDVHVVAAVHGGAFAPRQESISGLVRLALSFSAPHNWTRFRKLFRQVVNSQIKIMIGTPPVEALVWRRRALMLFCSRGSYIIQKLLALEHFVNGDWRKSGVIEVYVDRVTFDKWGGESLKKRFAYAVEYALASFPPPVYNRSRWTGLDLSLDSVGRLLICHRLLEHVYPLYVASFGTGSQVQPPRPVTFDSGGHEHPAIEDANVGGGLGGAGVTGDDDTHGGPNAPPKDDNSWQEEQTQNRRAGLGFVSKSPLTTTIVLRLVVEPLRQLLTAKFKVADPSWEIEQRCLDIPRETPNANNSQRSFRAAVSATNIHEFEALGKLKMLFTESAMWELIPHSDVTEDNVADTFKMLSALGSLIHELLVSVHDRYPFRPFLALIDPDLAATIDEDSPCTRDAYMKQFLLKNKLATERGLLKLRVLGLLARNEIVKIECLHASVRRLLKQMSLQRNVDFPLLAARWTLGRFRADTRGHLMHGKTGDATDLGQQANPDTDPEP